MPKVCIIFVIIYIHSVQPLLHLYQEVMSTKLLPFFLSRFQVFSQASLLHFNVSILHFRWLLLHSHTNFTLRTHVLLLFSYCKPILCFLALVLASLLHLHFRVIERQEVHRDFGVRL